MKKPVSKFAFQMQRAPLHRGVVLRRERAAHRRRGAVPTPRAALTRRLPLAAGVHCLRADVERPRGGELPKP